MIWLRFTAIFLLFYFLAILQNSFFSQFQIFGGSLNIIFVLFFIFTFFSKRKVIRTDSEKVFYTITAGLFLDIFSNLHFGVSIFSIFITGLLINKIQNSLQSKYDNFPVSYFIPIFIVSFSVYRLLVFLFSNIANISNISVAISFVFVSDIIYNLIFSLVLFFLYKKYFMKRNDR